MKIACVALGAAMAAGLFLADPAAAEEEWVVTLTNGKRFTGEIVSRREDGLTLRIGGSDVTLSSKIVSRVDRIEKEPEPVAPPEEAEEDEAAAEEVGGGGGELPEGAPAGPRPAAILLRDGTVVEGFVVSRGGGLLWIVPAADLRSVSEDDVSETFGDATGSEGGITFSGDALQDSRKMLDELGSDDPMRITVAATVLDRYGAEAGPILIEGLRHAKGSVRKQCIALLQSYRVKKAVDPVLGVLRNDFDPDVRAAAAAGMFEWNSPEVRRALLDAAWRDRTDAVKIACLNTLARCATAEEATALMDLLAIFDASTPTGLSVMAALKQATGQQIADDPDLWRKWWFEGGGRQLIGARVEKIGQDRLAESERQYRRLMGGDETPPTPEPEAQPAKPTGPLTVPIPGEKQPAPPPPPHPHPPRPRSREETP